MKKIISVLLTCLMLLSVVPSAVSAYGFLPFTDVKEDAWYYEGVEYCYMLGIVSGMTDTKFLPNGELTRAQFVQILAMHAMVDLDEYKNGSSGFEDVKKNHWFNAPVCWAVEQGYVAGLSETRFGPNERITREQLARLLYLYAESNGVSVDRLADLSGYTDKPSDWAYTQVQWAVGAGIISGMTETTIAPRNTATRAQACRMIMIYDQYQAISYIYDTVVGYVSENGVEYPDGSAVGLFKETEDKAYIIEYTPDSDELYLVYVSEPISSGNNIFDTKYREKLILALNLLAGEAYFSYTYESEDSSVKISASGSGAAEEYGSFEYEGISGEQAKAKIDFSTEEAAGYLIEIMAEAVARGLYNNLTAYITENGIEDTENGVIDLITEAEDCVYVAEYLPATDELYSVYAADPKAGGTDVFDTEYREKAVVAVDSLLSDEYYFIYTYESEDGTKTVDATGYYDGFEVTFETSSISGMTEDEAKEMITLAADEAIAYCYELLILTEQ